jgi:hypothetical protein
MKEAPIPPKRRLLQEPHGVTSKKTPFFIVTAVKASNLTSSISGYVNRDEVGQAVCCVLRYIKIKCQNYFASLTENISEFLMKTRKFVLFKR